MAAEGRHLVQPLRPGVGPGPVEPPRLRVVERPRLAHPVGRGVAHAQVLDGRGPGPEARCHRRVGHDPLVDRAEGVAELGRRIERVPEHRQPAAGAQHRRGLGRPGRHVDPVPRLPGDHGVERPPGRVPLLEPRHLHVQPARAGQLGHPGVGIDAEHPAPGRLEQPGRYAGAAAGVDDVEPGALGDDPVHHRRGVTGPGTVVAPGVGAERLGHLALPGGGGEGGRRRSRNGRRGRGCGGPGRLRR